MATVEQVEKWEAQMNARLSMEPRPARRKLRPGRKLKPHVSAEKFSIIVRPLVRLARKYCAEDAFQEAFIEVWLLVAAGRCTEDKITAMVKQRAWLRRIDIVRAHNGTYVVYDADGKTHRCLRPAAMVFSDSSYLESEGIENTIGGTIYGHGQPIFNQPGAFRRHRGSSE